VSEVRSLLLPLLCPPGSGERRDGAHPCCITTTGKQGRSYLTIVSRNSIQQVLMLENCKQWGSGYAALCLGRRRRPRHPLG
jgi:hypothetical protein